MPLLPLALSAHVSAWNPVGVSGGVEGQRPALDASCQFCGLHAAGWQEPFHCNGDHADASPGNIVSACPLCHLCQHLDRPHIHEEAALIWLPEMSQAAVIALARGVHLVLQACGEPAHMERGIPIRDKPGLQAAWAAHDALRKRTASAEERLGTASPLDLSAALLGLSPAALKRGGVLLRGLRLLPLGRLYRDGDDIYPKVLADWAAVASPASKPGPPPAPSTEGRAS